MLEAAVRADLVSGEQMTERKLALVLSVSCSTSLCSGAAGEMCLLAYEQGSVAGCATRGRLERSWELSAFPVKGMDEPSPCGRVSAGRGNHGGAPQSQGLVLTLPAAACCACLQRQPLPPSVSAPLLEQGSRRGGWQVFLGTAIPFIPPL